MRSHQNRIVLVTRSGFLSTNDEMKREKRLDMARASAVARDTCSSPTSLVVALIYLERLRVSNPRYLGTVASSADLFLVSLMVASKYLHDDGEEDEVRCHFSSNKN